MDRNKFITILSKVMYGHPEWMNDALLAISESVQEKIKDSQKTQVNIHYALAMLHDSPYHKLSAANRAHVDDAITKCDTFEGTVFADKAEKRLLSQH